MSEELAPLVLDVLPGAVVTVDLQDRVATWNRAAERLFGWTAAEVVGKRLPFVPDDGAERRQRWLERVAAGEDIEVTTQRLHRDGRLLDVVIRYAVARDAKGKPVGWVATFRDASSQLRTATRLQRSQAELVLIGKLSSLVQRMLQDLDLTGVLQAIVESGVELADADAGVVSLEQGPGRFVRMANINIPDDLVNEPVTPGVGLHGQVLESGMPMSIDDYDTWSEAAPKFRGRNFRASVAVPIVRDARVIGALSVHATSPKRRFGQAEIDVLVLLAEYASVAIGNATAYRRVSAEREKFLALVEAIPDGLAVIENGRVTAWNAAAARLTGRPKQEVLGGPSPIDLDAAETGLERAGHDGRLHWIETVASDLPNSQGRVYLIRDMTDQRELEQAKELFFAATSHELKTPLTVVRGLASTLRQHWSRMPEDQRQETLETIERRADSLDRLIERILVGSRVRAGGFEVTPTPVAVGRLVEDIAAGFAAASPSHTVRAIVEDDLPLVAGDRQAIDTILGHLVENAIKYSPRGGDVEVEAARDGDWLTVEVRDQGVGIEGDVERLLHPFVQAAATNGGAGGVGLGLYIVRQLVDALGGRITAANREHGGASFAFSLQVWG